MQVQLKSLSTVIILLQISYVCCSEGDRSPFYQKCVKKCLNANCTEGGEFIKNSAQKDSCRVLFWSCGDECRYHCMWNTVRGFIDYGYDIPKFHGKWPFTRLGCVQEPASVFASLLNLSAHIYMLLQIKSKFSIQDTPLVLFWYSFIGVCIHSWTWSIIFHTRDNFFTEFMDYSCALSMVMALFVASIVRVFHRRRKVTAVILVPALLYYIKHVEYLYSGRIDYEYNMIVNIFFGVVGSVIWVWWSCAMYLSERAHAHVWRLCAFTVLSGAALALELLDFPPLLGWDAHALWHLATAPLPLLFYRFVIDDLYYLQSSRSKLKVSKSN